MSFVHYLYLGHFEPDGEFVRFVPPSPRVPSLTPLVRRPLNQGIIVELLQERGVARGNRSVFPDDWPMWFGDGFLICKQFELSPEMVDFLIRLAKTTGCEIVDVNARRIVPPDELLGK
jgi:hypothetical protein